MVRIASILVSVLASVAAVDACAGWYQCKHADKSHCCVVDGGAGRNACPSYCTGGPALAECIHQVPGNSRHPS
ncbi:hypothetical protein E4U58_001571 [Claviceps cyperi]|nr:hypothetical protein E4U58_001571 [Claviceps cyperi]